MTETTQPTLDGFIDDDTAGPAPIVVDRSTLERYVDCPHAALMIDRKLVSTSSAATDAGDEAHRILAEAVRIRSTDGITPADLREFIAAEAQRSRPDVQPQVIAALRRAYPIVELICRQPGSGSERNPADLLRYDGGEGDHAGQLAADVLPATDDGSRGPVRLTGEVDLLMTTPSPEELELIDWKTGRTHWSASDVRESFQFQMYAWLVFMTYPPVQRVRVRVFLTRDGQMTGAVEFHRGDDFPAIDERLRSAARVYLRYHRAEDPADVPPWPAPEKCVLCPAGRFCTLAHRPARSVATDPEGAIRQLVALEAAAASIRNDLTTARRKRGEDWQLDDGLCFGTERPKATRAAACDVYQVGGGGDFGSSPKPESVGKAKK